MRSRIHRRITTLKGRLSSNRGYERQRAPSEIAHHTDNAPRRVCLSIMYGDPFRVDTSILLLFLGCGYAVPQVTKAGTPSGCRLRIATPHFFSLGIRRSRGTDGRRLQSSGLSKKEMNNLCFADYKSAYPPIRITNSNGETKKQITFHSHENSKKNIFFFEFSPVLSYLCTRFG